MMTVELKGLEIFDNIYNEYTKLKLKLKDMKNYTDCGAGAFKDAEIVNFLEECGIND